jgi:DNA-directed RNA polymerase sigma subunit (sigma70/sigma32)
MPAKASQQLAAVRRAEAELERIEHRRASGAAVAEHTQLSVTTIRSLRGGARVTASLDEPIGEDATPLGDLLADERAGDPVESAIARETRHEFASMVRLLPERHREVIVRRHGLSDDAAETHEQIGAVLGGGEERSSQIEREALHRLRSIAAASAQAA